MTFLLHLLVFHFILQSIECSAILSVELLNYTNPRGATAFGKRCDLWPGGKEVACDPVFRFCISPWPSNKAKCIWTKSWMNKNSLQFSPGMDLGYGNKNPILYKFAKQWEGQISIDVTAKDEDGLFDDQMDMFRTSVKLDGKKAESQIVMEGEMSSFAVKIRTLCIDSKESDCMKSCRAVLNEKKRWVCQRKIKCVPRDDDRGHYECDEITGKIKCLPGWTNESRNCLNDVRSDVTCSTNYMRIDIKRKYFQPSKYSQISLLDRSCKETVSKTHIILDSPPQLCGAITTETQDYIIYENEAYMKAIPTQELITREHDVRIKFKCSYKKSDITGWTAFKPLTSIDVQADTSFLYTRPDEQTFSYGKKGYSALTFNFKMYKDYSFKKLQSTFPVKVKLNQSMYFEVNSTSNDDDLVLLIDRCFATPTMKYNSRTKYTFIDNGCPKDKTVELLQGDRKKKRFSLDTFAFVKRSPKIFLHCVLFMCRKLSVESQCRRGCNGNNLGRARRDLEARAEMGDDHNKARSYSNYYLLDIGPIQGESDERFEEQTGAQKIRKEGISLVTVCLIVGVSVLGLIAITMFVKMKRNNNNNNQQPATVSDADQN